MRLYLPLLAAFFIPFLSLLWIGRIYNPSPETVFAIGLVGVLLAYLTFKLWISRGSSTQ